MPVIYTLLFKAWLRELHSCNAWGLRTSLHLSCWSQARLFPLLLWCGSVVLPSGSCSSLELRMNTPHTCTSLLHLLYLGWKWWFRVRCTTSIHSPLTPQGLLYLALSHQSGGCCSLRICRWLSPSIYCRVNDYLFLSGVLRRRLLCFDLETI